MNLFKYFTGLIVATSECIRDQNDSRFDPDQACLSFNGRRKDGRCIMAKMDSRYNPLDPCLQDTGPTAVPVQPTYRGQRRDKFVLLTEDQHDPNDTRYNGSIKGDYIRDENDSRYDPTDERHQNMDYNGNLGEGLGWH